MLPGPLGNVGWREEASAAEAPKALPVAAPAAGAGLDKSKKYVTSDMLDQHQEEDSVWFSYQGQVFDGTKFLEDHPGGADSILMAGGTDATDDFNAVHSDDAKQQLRDYYIAEMAPEGVQVRRLWPYTWLCVQLIAVLNPVVRGAVRSHAVPVYAAPRLALESAQQDCASRDAVCTNAAVVSTVLDALLFKRRRRCLQVPAELLFPDTRGRRGVSAQADDATADQPFLSAKVQKKVTLVEKEKLSHNVTRFRFALDQPERFLGLPTGKHMLIRKAHTTKEGQEEMVMRAYTPTTAKRDARVLRARGQDLLGRPAPALPRGRQVLAGARRQFCHSDIECV